MDGAARLAMTVEGERLGGLGSGHGIYLIIQH
jgi:hypothetical protein